MEIISEGKKRDSIA